MNRLQCLWNKLTFMHVTLFPKRPSLRKWKGERSRWSGRRRVCGLARTPPVGKAILTSKSSVCVVSWKGISEFAADAILKSRQPYMSSMSSLSTLVHMLPLFICYLLKNTSRVRVVTERHLQLVIDLGHVVGNWRDFASNFSPTQASRLGWSWARTRTWAQF